MKSIYVLTVLTSALSAIAAPVPDPVAEALPFPSPTDIPTATTARKLLASLTIAPQGSQSGYSRSLFPHWITISGACDTREVVLKRDGTSVVQNPSTCAAESGTWTSPYDGATWTSASDLDIDHFVPLSNAWKSGASKWTTAQRQAFANDLVRPQLWAVTDNVNESKGDDGPEDWKPPLESFYCKYAEAWVEVKSFYGLTVTEAESGALGDMLDTC